MTHTQTNFGIVTEFNTGRFTIFDTDNLTVLHQINIPSYDYIDVAITSDCSRALITAFSASQVVQVDLTQEPPLVIDDESTPINAEDVALTPDNNFGVIVNGGGAQGITSYSLLNQTIVDTIPNLAIQAVAVSPNGNGLILGADFSNDQVRVLTIDNTGNLTDTGTTVLTGGEGPINITFHPTGNFAFVANFFGVDIAIFDTSGPIPILVNNVTPSSLPQTIVVSQDGNTVFVLTSTTVDVFTFTPTSPFLTLVNSFPHGLGISSFFGVDEMALDATQSRLFITGSNTLAAFTTGGTPLGIVPGVLANGGVATCLLQQEPLTITCTVDITQENDPGQCGANVTYPPPTVTGGVPPIDVVCTPASGSFFPVGTTTVTCTATDAAGNTSTCSFTVTVNDTEPPQITCSNDVIVDVGPGETGAIVTYPSPTVSDNCPGAAAVCSPASGSFFLVGTTTVTCTATDAVGNTSSCSFTVTVRRRFLECILVQKVYDWVVLTNRDRNKVPIPKKCFALIEKCRSEGRVVTTTCAEVEGTRRCDVLPGSRLSPNVPDSRIVTISFHVHIRIEFFCDNIPLCNFDVPIIFIDDVILCFPQGADINCNIFDVQCKVLLNEVLGNVVMLEVVMCKDVQVEAEVKMEVEAKFCGPRQPIPIEEQLTVCPFPTFPQQCSDIFPI